MSTSDSQRTEDLVAYLDGELNEDDTSQVEETLTEEPSVRQEVERLSRVWELLDLLPESKASPQFTEKTLSAVQTGKMSPDADDSDTRPVRAQPARAWKSRLQTAAVRTAGLIGLLVVGSIGFNGAFRRDTEAMDLLLNDLPVIERLDQYREAGSLEFLEALNRSGILDGESNRSSDD